MVDVIQVPGKQAAANVLRHRLIEVHTCILAFPSPDTVYHLLIAVFVEALIKVAGVFHRVCAVISVPSFMWPFAVPSINSLPP